MLVMFGRKGRKTHLIDILSVLFDEVIVAPGRSAADGLAGKEELLEYMLEGKLTTAMEISVAIEVCRPELLKQFPWLNDIPPIPPSELDGRERSGWTRYVLEIYGVWQYVRRYKT
jgi:hypothetical protein